MIKNFVNISQHSQLLLFTTWLLSKENFNTNRKTSAYPSNPFNQKEKLQTFPHEKHKALPYNKIPKNML